MASKEFSNVIKTIRSNKGLTMQNLADELNVTKGAVNMWENKGVVPREDILIKISKLYGISIDKMLGNDIDFEDKIKLHSHYLQNQYHYRAFYQLKYHII